MASDGPTDGDDEATTTDDEAAGETDGPAGDNDDVPNPTRGTSEEGEITTERPDSPSTGASPSERPGGGVGSLSLDASSVVPLLARGVGAFVAGYVLLLAVVFLGPSQVAGVSARLFVELGFIYYSALNVSLVAPEVTYNAIAAQARLGGTTIPIAVFFAIPVVATLAAGLELGTRHLGPDVPLGRIAAATLVLAVGFALTALAGTLVVRTSAIHPSYLRAVVFGLAYPVVFGFVGALVGRTLARARVN